MWRSVGSLYVRTQRRDLRGRGIRGRRSADPDLDPDLDLDHVTRGFSEVAVPLRSDEDREGKWSPQVQVTAGSLQDASTAQGLMLS